MRGLEAMNFRSWVCGLVVLATLWLSGCAAYVHRYKTLGSGNGAEFGDWRIQLSAFSDDSYGVQLRAWVEEEIGRRPIVDEFLMVDSLAVETGGGDQWLTVAPHLVEYGWSHPHPGDSPGLEDYFRITVVDSVQWRALRRTVERPGQGKPWIEKRDERRLVLRPAVAGIVTSASNPRGDGLPLSVLSSMTMDELIELWKPEQVKLEVYFPAYERRGGNCDRRLTFYLRTLDRRTSELIKEGVLVFDQDCVGQWRLWGDLQN